MPRESPHEYADGTKFVPPPPPDWPGPSDATAENANKSGLPWWMILLIVILIPCTVSLMTNSAFNSARAAARADAANYKLIRLQHDTDQLVEKVEALARLVETLSESSK